MSTPEVKVKVSADTSSFERGIDGVQARLSTFAKVAGVAAAGAVIGLATGMVAMTKASMDNIDALAKQARVAGVTVSQFQAMALVAEEAGVSSDALSRSLIKMQSNLVDLNKGAAAQVAAFGALGVSYSDLQKMDAAGQFELLAARISDISDPAQRTAAALDIFGKSGADALNMLGGYSTALADAAKYQRDLGLAVSDVDAAQIEAANDAMGRTSTAIAGLGTTLAVTFAPAIEGVALGLTKLVKDVMGAQTALDATFGNEAIARTILGNEIYDQIQSTAGGFEQLAGKIGAVQGAMAGLNTQSDETQQTIYNLANALRHAGEYDLATRMAALAESIATTRDEFNDGALSADTFRARMGDAENEAARLMDEAGRINGIQTGQAQQAVAALGAVLDVAAGKALALGTAMSSFATGGVGAGASGAGSMQISSGPQTSPRPQQRPMDLGASIGGGGGGGGGGVVDAFAQRLEALQDSLQTEAEVVQEWYDESLTTLQTALERKALTEEEYRATRERLEQEHQDRLAGIQDIASESSVSAVLGAGAEILNAIGQNNKKALKIAKVFAAGQALINAYQGASEALKLPFPKNIAAAAAVLAKGIGFVNAIKSVNDSGGSSGAAGGAAGGSGGGGAAAQQPLTTFQFTLTNDPMGFGENFARQMIEQLNTTQRNGGQIRGVIG